ncbi:hypothetical protein [Brucella anthropi]|nr:hypothetical protein [Brucella anthropi]
MANCKRLILGLVVVGALALTGPALAEEAMRSVDASGNLVVQMPDNGAKIIRVGAAQ